MSVVLQKLTFSDMFSYGSNNMLILNANPVTQLLAVNGVGKSSLATIIQELLFNKNIKGLKKAEILNRYSGSKSWEGQIDFSVDGVNYSVHSKRTGASTAVTFMQEGKDISEHKVLDTYKRIAEVLGRDFETFSQLTYQSSTDSLEFLKATDSNRKKFLISLFNLEKYINIGEQIKTIVSAKEKELSIKQGELKTVVSFIEENPLPDRAELKALPVVDTNLYTIVDTLRKRIAAQKSVCDAIDKNNLYLKERDSIVLDMSLMPVTIPEELTSSISSITAKITQLTTIQTKAKKDLKALDVSDICYACKQPIDNSQSRHLSEELNAEIAKIEKELGFASVQLKNLKQELETLLQEKKKFEDNQRNIDRFSQLSQLIDPALPKDYPDYNKLVSELKQAEQELAWQEKALSDAQQYNDRVKIRNAKIDGLVDQIRNFKARQELLNNDIVVIQGQITRLSILRKAFSTSGIVAFKLENVAKQLESSINYYLASLSDGQFQVVFRLEGEKLNIIVINNGQEVSIESLSGGEFSRVQTSVLLAVRKTLSTVGGKSINLLFLDEVMAVLDDAGKESLIDVLRNEEDLNVFLISHEYRHPLIPTIEITKENNISTIYS